MRIKSLSLITLATSLLSSLSVHGMHYDPAYEKWNLNTNQNANSPLDYSGVWQNHTFHPSPDNWRFPFYTLMMDRWVNGDPSNDNANGTVFEQDSYETQLRHGGDVRGVKDSLDYLQGMGIKAIYAAGTIFINAPSGVDGYSPLDTTLLDPHLGTIDDFRETIDEIHRRGMYIMVDMTVGTMGDLIGFNGFLNTSTPFSLYEHTATWRGERQYLDYKWSNEYNTSCTYPRFWGENGLPVVLKMTGCYNSEFDQYGDTEAFGVFPDWQRQLSKFASVQDRLREWNPNVGDKIKHLSCLVISMLDVDGFRIDKATQVTPDFLADWGEAMHQCARQYGKTNFFIPGEVTGGDTFGAIYIGRGRQPNNRPPDFTTALSLTNTSSEKLFLRSAGKVAIDAVAFHYSMYRALTRFLGMDGNLNVAYDTPVDFVGMWNTMATTNDFLNNELNVVDPRHMYGTSNQDVFRWPSIINGTAKQNLGAFACALVMPGTHTLLWGEEQDFHVFDSTAANYLFGRQAMTSAQAWQDHGCYKLNSTQYVNFGDILDQGKTGCGNDWNSLDHRDPTAEGRRYLQTMYYMRENYPSLNDGFVLQQLSNHTDYEYLVGSNNTPTEIGLWSVSRSPLPASQDFSKLTTAGNLTVWLLYTNMAQEIAYTFDCTDNTTALLSPYFGGTTVKNLFYPYEEYNLQDSTKEFFLNGSAPFFGCLDQIDMKPYSFKALVPKADWIEMYPVITQFSPGHDARILAGNATIDLEFKFSQNMSCDSVTKGMTFTSVTETGVTPQIQQGSVSCSQINPPEDPEQIGALPSTWSWKGTIENVADGMHQITLTNISNSAGTDSTRVTDNFILRVGQANNPIVFPRTANVSDTLLHKDGSGKLYISHQAPGAELFRYSTNFESTYSDWIPYGNGGNYTLAPTVWSGTDQQKWEGDHVTVQYWSSIAGSASHRQDADLGLPDGYPPHRRWPHVFIMGPFNLFGFDAGVENNMVLGTDGNWTYNFMEDWPSQLQANIWGINPDKQPDQSFVYGDVDGDNVLDRLPPSSLSQNMMNVTEGPLPPYLSWKVVINDGSRRFVFVPQGSRHLQMTLFALLWVIPPVTAMLAVFIFKRSFYQVKFNTEGAKSMTSFIPLLPLKKLFSRGNKDDAEKGKYSAVNALTPMTNAFDILGAMGGKKPGRRTVLIATLEYDISDWNIKIKIGGLGVMAQLMGKNLKHQDLVWVVPCVGDVEYPKDVDGEPIEVTILKQKYSIDVTYHQLENIKYILLDAPVFRRQTTKEPYPPRMDDLESAIFYSAWNQCIAQVITRFPIDLYHINDYHGALAPVYLLPDVIPCAVSLHNAEFQGLWPLRTPQEKEEVCSVYNITEDVCSRYVQFGNVFNLLHAGISYLRIHQKGFGAVGVSDKYGKRSWARYPIFWGLSKIGKLPNPDPSDTGAFDSAEKSKAIVVDREFEAKRADLKRQAQEWAGLHTDPDAELLVFVGRWSMQKGIDLIADLAPTLLEEFNVQLLCVGPVIDLYGRFAAEKLNHLMNMYPGRVFSRPEFTALPPYIFSGAEFALIPSRDEPFGLVAVEFGRKGALGIGAKVGGLGQMPGWWYTIESTTTKHLLTQFEHACREALASDRPTRELMRAKSAKQRFPVVEWVRKLDKLQSTAIKMCERSKKRPGTSSGNKGFRQSLQKFGVPPKSSHGSEKGLGITMSPNPSVAHLTPPLQRDPHRESYASSAASDPYDDPYDAGGEGTRTPTYPPQRNASDTSLRDMGDDASSIEIPRRGIIEPPPKGSSLSRKLSLGTRLGPGHTSQQRHASMATIESLGPIDEEQHYAMPGDDDDDEYMYSAAAIRRQMAKNVGSKRGPGYTDGNESSDVESDYAPTPDNASLFEFDPQRSSVYDMGTRGTDSMYFDEDPYNANNPYNTRGDYFSHMPRNENVGLGVYAAEDPEQAPLHGERRTEYAAGLSPPVTPFARMSQSHLSLASVTGGRDDFALSNVKENFTDADGKYFKVFSSELHKIDPKTSKEDLCIEEYIMKSEKEWSKDQLNKKLGLDHMGSDAKGYKMPPSSHLSDDGRLTVSPPESHADEPLFGYKRPSGVRLLLQRRIGDWPVYSFLLALGQVIAASSFQLTLLTNQVTQADIQLYILASIYLVSSIIWWLVFRRFQAIWCLSVPFYLYGIAFFLIGLPFFGPFQAGRFWINNVGTGLYGVASASGSLFFALNFADEGGAPVTSWVYRACVIQGSQQIFAAGLWYWGHRLTTLSSQGLFDPTTVTTSAVTTAVTWSLGALFIAVGVLLFMGLPEYYRQLPGRIPAFYKSLTRRKLVLWFFVAVCLQNFWLSAPYGRNWSYLWIGTTPTWQTVLLIAAFFLGVWGLFLLVIGILSRKHSWILPVFAIGLGAPRWCQMLWGTTFIGHSLPWADIGEGVTRIKTGLLVGKSLWLWLGVLDAIQGVGLGMLLLQTLTRMHIAFTLITAQVLGSIATILARAIAPDREGPGDVFPDFSFYSLGDPTDVFKKAWFYVGLISQIVICIGYFLFFRKEQLAKP